MKVAILVACGALLACTKANVERGARSATGGGDPQKGRSLVRQYGCGTCHELKDVPGATGTIGPPLDGVAMRAYLAGHLPNDPANLIRWVMHPQKLEPGVAMPEMGVTEGDARDLAAYLYTLR